MHLEKILDGSERPQDEPNFDRPAFLIWLWGEYCNALSSELKQNIMYEMCCHHQFVEPGQSKIYHALVNAVREAGRAHKYRSSTSWAIIGERDTIVLQRARSTFDEGMEAFSANVNKAENPYQKNEDDDDEFCRWFEWNQGWESRKRTLQQDSYWSFPK